jgi:rsbT antagonist protein RsbS
MTTEHRLPIIKLFSNLIVPIQSGLPDASLARLKDDVTRRIVEVGPKGLVIDVSAVVMMDSYFTHTIRDLAMMSRLMGVRTVLVGVPPSVAITMVDMGLDITDVVTALDLDRAIEMLSGGPSTPVVDAIRGGDAHDR